MQIEILGDLRVKDDHGRTLAFEGRRRRRRCRNLICVLAFQRWTPALSADQLKLLLWDTDQNKTSALTSLIHATRQGLPNGWLITAREEGGPERYQLRRRVADRVDVDVFRDAVSLADRARRVGDLHTAIRHYSEGLGLWRPGEGADPLPDIPGTLTMAEERELLLRERREATEAYVEARMDAGDHSLALADRIRDLMAHQPVNSRLLYLRMLVLHLAGRKAEALTAYQDAAHVFATHFDSAPGPTLDRLRDQIMYDDPSLHWSPLSPTPKRQSATLVTGAPSPRGVHNAILGGKDNCAADRAIVDGLNRETGDAYRQALIEERQALARIINRCAKAGIHQVLDLGSGLPAPAPHPQVHELAQRAAPDARVLYIDNDPVVAAHANALMTDGRGVIFRRADIADTQTVLYEARRHFDLDRPVAVAAAGVLPYLGTPDADLGTAEVAELLRTYMDALPDGSVLAITHLTGDGLDPRLRPHVDATTPHAELPHYLRTTAQIRALFGDLPIRSPGLVRCHRWGSRPSPGRGTVRILAGLAVKGEIHVSAVANPALGSTPLRTRRPSRPQRYLRTSHPADTSRDISSSKVAP